MRLFYTTRKRTSRTTPPERRVSESAWMFLPKTLALARATKSDRRVNIPWPRLPPNGTRAVEQTPLHIANAGISLEYTDNSSDTGDITKTASIWSPPPICLPGFLTRRARAWRDQMSLPSHLPRRRRRVWSMALEWELQVLKVWKSVSSRHNL